MAEDPDVWLLKGGVALDYRLGEARSTGDLDLSSNISIAAFTEKLVQAVATDLGDHFEVRVSSAPFRPVDEVETYRFQLDVRLNNKIFVKISIDIGFADPWIGEAESLTSETLVFAGAQPVVVRAIPIEQHIAEKIHAYTKSYNGHPSSRVKDLVDLVLLLGYRPLGKHFTFRYRHRVSQSKQSRAASEPSTAAARLGQDLREAFGDSSDYARRNRSV